MLRTRVIPCLLLRNAGLVKTTRFKDPVYIGDPINTVRIFNEKEVDELTFLDITATPENRKPPFKLLSEIAGECFMPLGYGGGVRSLDDIGEILGLGVEKIIINSYAVEHSGFIRESSERFGSQSIVVSIDARRKPLFGGYEVRVRGGREGTGLDPVRHAVRMQEQGAGEILVSSIDRDGTMSGYDLELVRAVSGAVDIPVIACGGAGSVAHFAEAVQAGASAVAAGAFFVFQGKHRAVLINVPPREEIERHLG